MGAGYSHTSRPDGTKLTGAIYDTDHQNHIDNAVPSLLDDYSTNAAQMASVADPGESGSENLPTSLAGELERLRHQIKEMKETLFGASIAKWYTSLLHSGAITYPGVGGTFFKFTLPNGIMVQSDIVSLTNSSSTIGSVVDTSFAFTTPYSEFVVVFGAPVPNGSSGGSTGNESLEHTFEIGAADFGHGYVRIMRHLGTAGAGNEVYRMRWFSIGK